MKPTVKTDEYELYLADCLDVMADMDDGSVDAVVTDPPYLEEDFSYLLPALERLASRVVLTPGKLRSFDWIRRKAPFWEYAWKCSGTSSRGGSACLHILFEPILAYQRPLRPLGSDLLNFPLVVDKMADGHPWPKPYKLIEKLVRHWSDPGEVVLDPFMGSGTTGVACRQLDRKFIGIEINEEYFEIARKRLEMPVQKELI